MDPTGTRRGARRQAQADDLVASLGLMAWFRPADRTWSELLPTPPGLDWVHPAVVDGDLYFPASERAGSRRVWRWSDGRWSPGARLEMEADVFLVEWPGGGLGAWVDGDPPRALDLRAR